MRRKKIGTMDFHGSVDITDPCYNRDVWCRMTDVNIRNGVYTCIAWHQKDKGTFDNGEPYCYDVIGIIGIYLDGVNSVSERDERDRQYRCRCRTGRLLS